MIRKLQYFWGNFKVSYKDYPEPGPDLEPQFGFAAPWSWSRKKYFRLHNTGLSKYKL
jgi:hypothetical protein